MRQHAARVRADEAAVEATLASRSREQQRTARWATLSSLLRCKARHQSFASLCRSCACELKPALCIERADLAPALRIGQSQIRWCA